MSQAPKLSIPPPSRSFLARARRYIERRGLIHAGDRVLAAVSGGPDSTCLLLTLAFLRATLDLDLQVAHFDHGLRGKRAATAERLFVERLCGSLDVPLHVDAGDARAHARKTRRSIEDAARELRYQFLARIARQTRCVVVATGHTRDDQAETVLLHLIRGSGLRGLAGIAPASSWPFPGKSASVLRLVRPLLEVSRDDTERCCRESGIEPLDDPSNRSSAFLRNRIRRELLPELSRYNPRIHEALAGFADSVGADLTALELAASALVEERGDQAVIQRRAFRQAPLGIQAHAVCQAFVGVAGDARNLGRRHISAVVAAAAGPTGSSLDLPRGVGAEIRRDAIVLSRCHERRREVLPGRPVRLSVPGHATFGPWRFEAEVVRSPSRLDTDAFVAFFDENALGRNLTLRSRRDGDRFRPLGMAANKKLQDFFVDAHVPRDERDATPLLCSERRIAWVVGQRPAEWAKLRPGARRAVRVSAKRAAEHARGQRKKAL